MLLIYRTASVGEFIESVQPLLAWQTDEFYQHLNNPDIFCFDDADCAKDFMHWFGLWWGKSCYEDMGDLDYSHVSKTLASRDGKIQCISEAGELPVRDETVEGVLISFSVDEEHSQMKCWNGGMCQTRRMLFSIILAKKCRRLSLVSLQHDLYGP